MKVTLLEAYYSGSHKLWADQLKQNSKHDIELITLPGYFWKWRMHGGAISLFQSFRDRPAPDVVIATDMLDLSTFRSLMHMHNFHCPTILYFHENQLTYPWSPNDTDRQKGRDMHYGFINYTSALCADQVVFNSEYHRHEFLGRLGDYLRRFPDHQNIQNVDLIRGKSCILSPGLDNRLWELRQPKKNEDRIPLILWNHRWEYDKNPEIFFRAIGELKNRGIAFHLCVLGENFEGSPSCFHANKELFKDEIVQWGYAKTREEYLEWLLRADVLPVTSNQDFFGISTLEAIACGVYPLLPRRLAFPEHLDSGEYYYDTDEELSERLIDLFVHRKFDCESDSRINEVRKYGWQEIAGDYDNLLDKFRTRDLS